MDWRQKLLNAARSARHKYNRLSNQAYIDAIDKVTVNDDFDKAFEIALNDIGQRDREITVLYYQGQSSIGIGLRYGISASRVLQIVHTSARLLLKGTNINLFLSEEDRIKNESA